MMARRAAFSLLEVMIALGVLALSLTVLVDAQATAVMMTREAENITTATMLAREKTSEVMLILETKGFQQGEVYEEGDFSKGVLGDYAGGGLDGRYEDINEKTFDGFSWAYTIREVELEMPGDLGSMADQLTGMSPMAENEQAASQFEDQKPDLNDLGVSNDMLTQMVSPYIREVRVTVWWGEDYKAAEENGDLVEIVTHAVNPSGQMVPGGGGGDSTGGDGDGGTGGSGGGSGGSGGGSGGSGGGIGGSGGGSGGGIPGVGNAVKKGGR